MIDKLSYMKWHKFLLIILILNSTAIASNSSQLVNLETYVAENGNLDNIIQDKNKFKYVLLRCKSFYAYIDSNLKDEYLNHPDIFKDYGAGTKFWFFTGYYALSEDDLDAYAQNLKGMKAKYEESANDIYINEGVKFLDSKLAKGDLEVCEYLFSIDELREAVDNKLKEGWGIGLYEFQN